MSAPDTNVEKQKRRHKPALLAIGAVVAFAAIVFLFNLNAAVDDEAALVGDDAQMIDGQATN